ncbi:MAG TPA: hypothetical protein PLK55_00640 [archaeon]|jgi:hypothetical protein|nr:hypothetical protein [archaeon]
MTKSFEVAISIILLLFFVFFLFETINQKYSQNPIPEEVKTIILLEARDSGFRELISNSEVDNVYSLLYPQMDYRFNVSICDWLDDNCENRELENFAKKREFVYFFSDTNKTLHIELD